jgi:hypothetical protein
MIDTNHRRRIFEAVGEPMPPDEPQPDIGEPPRGPYGDGRYTDFGADPDPEPPRGRNVAQRGAAIINEIHARRDEPLVPIEIGGGHLCEIYLGGIGLLIGGTGAGKTSLALEAAIRHAVSRGPAIVASLELPERILGARVVGIQCDESWTGVLTGSVGRDQMLQQWPERLHVIGRRDATIRNLHASLAALTAEYPDEPMLLVVDYVQLMDNDEREIRRRVARAMEHLDELATEHRCVVLALSQGSRASSRQLASGERLGRETADAGAEAAELERWSVCTIGIGGHGPGDSGWSAVDVSIGKGRLGGGDTVHSARYCGRTGAWRLAGEARTAAEVRAERTAQQSAQRVTTLAYAIPGRLAAADKPMSRRDLASGLGRASDVRAAVDELLQAASGAPGDVVQVGSKANGAYRLWTRQRALDAGLAIVPPGVS